MRWRRSAGDSGQVEDLRRSGGGRMATPGRIGGGLGGLGLIGVIVALLVIALGGGGGGGFGIDPGAFEALPQAPQAGGPGLDSAAPDPDEDLVQFVTFVVGDVQGFWEEAFAGSAQP
jgi:predicted metalloprotease